MMLISEDYTNNKTVVLQISEAVNNISVFSAATA